MNDAVILELSQELGHCSGGVASILEKHYQLSKSELDDAILENYGFLLAYILNSQGLNLEECKMCVVFFVGMTVGMTVAHSQEKFMHISNAIHFYQQQLLELAKAEGDFFRISIIVYNLLHPAKWNDFSRGIPLEDMNFLEVVEVWSRVASFLREEVPQHVNPILERL